jgi:hypothetical protein
MIIMTAVEVSGKRGREMFLPFMMYRFLTAAPAWEYIDDSAFL